jgi:hypothetical protein
MAGGRRERGAAAGIKPAAFVLAPEGCIGRIPAPAAGHHERKLPGNRRGFREARFFRAPQPCASGWRCHRLPARARPRPRSRGEEGPADQRGRAARQPALPARVGSHRTASGRAARRGGRHRARHRDQAAAGRQCAACRLESGDVGQHRPPQVEPRLRRCEPHRLFQPGHRPDPLQADHRARPAAAGGDARCDLRRRFDRHRLLPVSLDDGGDLPDGGRFDLSRARCRHDQLEDLRQPSLPPRGADACAAQHAGTGRRGPSGALGADDGDPRLARPQAGGQRGADRHHPRHRRRDRGAVLRRTAGRKGPRVDALERSARRRLPRLHGIRRRWPRAGGRPPHGRPAFRGERTRARCREARPCQIFINPPNTRPMACCWWTRLPT